MSYRSDGRQRLVVIDTETTGLGTFDRVVEVAAIVLDRATGETLDEYDTLVNPMRDIGPVRIHGISSSMVSAAPTFEEIAASLALRVEGAVLVAHNLSFDVRMLDNEYQRLDAQLDPGDGICTLRLSGEKLSLACDRYEIPMTRHHRALSDARATAQLVKILIDEETPSSPASILGLSAAVNPRTHRRDVSSDESRSQLMGRLIATVRYPTSDGDLLTYLNALDWVLDDLEIDDAEKAHLKQLAGSLDLTATQIASAHRAYLLSLISAANRDNIITDEEDSLLRSVARLLDIDEVELPRVTATVPASAELVAGTRVCFTGEVVVDGEVITRSDLEETAAAAGLQPVASVTKKCDLLVCADPSSMSKKTKTARDYQIPIMSITEFIKTIGFVDLP
jgi:DNA polymerase-3 subunit epsilon